jgi:putative transcriptional regulator
MVHICPIAKIVGRRDEKDSVYLSPMGLLEELPFPPDEELRRFLEECDVTNGRMYQNQDQKDDWGDSDPAVASPLRPKYYGRQPSNNLSRARAKQLMTQTELAEKTGTTRKSISRIENGRYEPSVYLALAIAQALDSPVEDIFHLPHVTPVPPPQNTKTLN